ncbi:MAG: hypothetical protein ACOH2T_23375 [Pseudomonas sp.]
MAAQNPHTNAQAQAQAHSQAVQIAKDQIIQFIKDKWGSKNLAEVQLEISKKTADWVVSEFINSGRNLHLAPGYQDADDLIPIAKTI